MVDQTLKELWETKDNIAKEHSYDLDALVKYLQSKSRSRDGNVFQGVSKKDAKQKNHRAELNSEPRNSLKRDEIG